MNNSKHVLVLGSKPGSMFPNIKIKKIYSANAAAERVLKFKEKYSDIKHVALIGSKEFSENKEVSSRVIKAKPDELYCRSGKIIVPQELQNCKLTFLTQKEQFSFQSKFYQKGGLDIILGETFFYETNIMKILKHFYACCKYRGFWGVATGFYSILLALYENPDCDVIVSGVGLVEGGHFYTSEKSYGYVSERNTKMINEGKIKLYNKFRNTSRCRVERYLIKKVKKRFKDRIISVDEEMVFHGNVKPWNGSKF